MFPNARRVSVNCLAVDVWVDRDPRVRDPRHGEGLLERLYRRKHEGSVKSAGYRKPFYFPNAEIVFVFLDEFETLKNKSRMHLRCIFVQCTIQSSGVPPWIPFANGIKNNLNLFPRERSSPQHDLQLLWHPRIGSLRSTDEKVIKLSNSAFLKSFI